MRHLSCFCDRLSPPPSAASAEAHGAPRTLSQQTSDTLTQQTTGDLSELERAGVLRDFELATKTSDTDFSIEWLQARDFDLERAVDDYQQLVGQALGAAADVGADANDAEAAEEEEDEDEEETLSTLLRSN